MTQHIISLRTLLALAFFMFVFAGIYTYVPDRKLSLKSQLPGAMFTTAGWILFSMAFSLYFKLFGGNNFSYMYGSLTRHCAAHAVALLLYLRAVFRRGAELLPGNLPSEEGKGL